jgi:putative heme-binding domain-containing protein
MRGQGSPLGPDLSNLVHRDYASVLKDITQPSAAISPDHVAYHLDLKAGDSLTVLRLADLEHSWLVADATGQTNSIPKAQIAASRTAAVSLMPEGLLQPLSSQQIKDLLAFLLLPPPPDPAGR